MGTPAHGTATISGTTQVVYTPTQDYNGSDSFSYTASDGNGGTPSGRTATVELSIKPINDAPDTVDDSVVTDEDTAVEIRVLTNDSDTEGDALTIVGLGQSRHGTVMTTTNTTIRYTPTADYNGADDFSYTISDGNGGTDTATVEVTVEPVDDPPEGVRDATILRSQTTQRLATTASAELDVLANDQDVDGDLVNVQTVGPAINGTVSLPDPGYPVKSKKITYTPAQAFTGTDVFTYTATDGAFTDIATVTVTVVMEEVATPVEPTADTTLVYTSTTLEVPAGALDQTSLFIYTERPALTQAVPGDLAFAGRAFSLDVYQKRRHHYHRAGYGQRPAGSHRGAPDNLCPLHTVVRGGGNVSSVSAREHEGVGGAGGGCGADLSSADPLSAAGSADQLTFHPSEVRLGLESQAYQKSMARSCTNNKN